MSATSSCPHRHSHILGLEPSPSFLALSHLSLPSPLACYHTGGRMLAARISERTVAIMGGVLFLAFCIHSLIVGP